MGRVYIPYVERVSRQLEKVPGGMWRECLVCVCVQTLWRVFRLCVERASNMCEYVSNLCGKCSECVERLSRLWREYPDCIFRVSLLCGEFSY